VRSVGWEVRALLRSARAVGRETGGARAHGRTLVGGRGGIFQVAAVSVSLPGRADVNVDTRIAPSAGMAASAIESVIAVEVAHVLESDMNHRAAG
jgi:hypothetical protein